MCRKDAKDRKKKKKKTWKVESVSRLRHKTKITTTTTITPEQMGWQGEHRSLLQQLHPLSTGLSLDFCILRSEESPY